MWRSQGGRKGVRAYAEETGDELALLVDALEGLELVHEPLHLPRVRVAELAQSGRVQVFNVQILLPEKS
jgi:hypothetical protein